MTIFNSIELEHVCDVIAGQSPPSSTYNDVGNGLPFFQGKADFGTVNPKVRMWCSEPKKISLPNDILMSVRAPVGPTNVNNVEACIGRGLSAIRCSNKIDQKYLLHFLRSNERNIADKGTGSTFKAITQKTLKALKIPLPPLAEQKKIAEFLDAADSLRQKDRQLIEQYTSLSQSLFLDMFGDPVINPMGWKLKEASKYYQVRGRVGWKGYKKTDLVQKGAIVLGATHIKKTGDLDLSKVVYLSDEKYLESPEIMVNKYDLIFVQRGNTIGKVALVRSELGEVTINPVVLIFRPGNANPFFLLYLLMNKRLNNEFVDSNSGSAQPMITQKTMKEFLMIDVPIDLQNQFAEKVKLIEVQKQQAQSNLEKSEALFNSLLQRAFKGELTGSKAAYHDDALQEQG